MDHNSSNLNVIISTKTWNKDTDDLYDFEAEDVTGNNFKLSHGDSSTYLISQDETISLVKDIGEVRKLINDKQNCKIMGEIEPVKNDAFQILNPMTSSKFQNFGKQYLDRLWLIFPKNEMRVVEEGDIIKIGRVRLKFDKIFLKGNPEISGMIYLKTNNTTNLNCNNQMFFNNNNNLSMNNNSSMIGKSNNNNSLICHLNNDQQILEDKSPKQMAEDCNQIKEIQYLCRICYRTESDISDPLLSPCKCTGSMSYIHYKCLKNCIDTKIQKKEGDNHKCFIWKNFECEICLHEYPKYIKYQNVIYNLVDLDINYDQYIVFDYTLYDDTKKRSFRKGIIVVKVQDDEEITIGRTQSNTIKLKDISVSRIHCVFIKKDNKIFVLDKGSKFGTLLYLKKPFTLTFSKVEQLNNNFYANSLVSLISGKNFFQCKLTKKWSLFSGIFGCCRCRITNEDEVILRIDDGKKKNEIAKIKEMNNNLQDSYNDYVINLETIINANDASNLNNNNDASNLNNNTNSFI